jgi:serine/threonine-protein phosphatase PP1 catalytic subunit
MLDQPNLMKIGAPVIIVGDLHGMYYDLLRIFHRFGFPDRTSYLFLGDYVNLGNDSADTLLLLLAFKILFPENLFLLRGDHEAGLRSATDFAGECRIKNIDGNPFTQLFLAMPIAAIVGSVFFCVHGGLSPALTSLNDIVNWHRPQQVAATGLIADLLQSEFSSSVRNFAPSAQGFGTMVGPEAVERFFKMSGTFCIVHGHVHLQMGADFPIDNVITLTSSAIWKTVGQEPSVMIVVAKGGSSPPTLEYTFAMFPSMPPEEADAFRREDFMADLPF